jgi:arabinogalactan oligomer/maltooligosaccharide transport system permease protein
MKKHTNMRKLRTSICLHTLLTVLSILWMLPVFWLLISSFRKEPGAYTPYLWPKAFTFDNYTRLFINSCDANRITSFYGRLSIDFLVNL